MEVAIQCLDLVGAVSYYLASDQEVVVRPVVDRLLVEAIRHLEAKVEEVVEVRHPEDRPVVDLVAMFVSTYLEMEEGNQAIE